MSNDIEIRVKIANQTATGLTAVNTSLNRLRDNARDAGQSLTGLTTRATAATVALRALKDSAQDAARALRSLNTAARNADGRMTTMSDRSRTLRRDTDDLDESMRRLTTTMGGLRGSAGGLNLGSSSNGMDNLRQAAIMLSPALIPIAASMAPIVANAGAAGVALGAFGLALVGQIGKVNDAADAQKKYDDAVKKHGPASQQAAQAEAMYLEQVRDMDPATRRAAAALGVMKDQYRGWSKALAGDTMPVFTKSLAVVGGLLPKLSPMVKGASGELDRFMTILAGGVNSGGFSAFMDSFAKFSTGALAKANDGLVRFMRTMSGGAGSSQLAEFMDYARKVGPQVGETLGNLAQALTHLVAAASDVGVSLLTAVNAFSQLVNAIPTEALGNLLQFVVVFKAVKLAAAGLGGTAGALSGFGAQLMAMRAASAAAGGGLSGLAAGFGALSRATKVALIGSGIGILVVALSELSEMGKKAPADVDKLTTSLRGLTDTGKITGEASRVFGKDLSGLADSLQKVTNPKGLDKFQQSIVSFFGTDSTPVKDAKDNIDSLDKSLSGLVKNGQADLAAQALDSVIKRMKDQGKDTKGLRSQLDDYKAALADAAFEQKLAAESMGLFGSQAASVQQKLNAQKASADGLRQSIQALSDTSRGAFDAQTRFEESLDKVTESIRENGRTLDISTEKGRANRDALSALATATQDAATKARENGASWSEVMGIYDKGHKSLVDNITAITGNRTEAERLAATLLKMPTPKLRLEMEKEDAQHGLEAFNAALKKTPGAHKVTLSALSQGAEEILESFGLKVKRLPNGKVVVTARNGQALSGIANVAAALNRLNGKTATTWTYHNVKTTYVSEIVKGKGSLHDALAAGGRVRGYAGGGNLQHFPDGGYVQGPGTPTSDSILASFASGATAAVSDTEYVVKAAAVRKYGVKMLDALNSGKLPVMRLAKGGVTKAEAQARREAMGDLTISRFGQFAGYSRSEFGSAFAKPDSLSALVNSLNQWRSVIQKATHGSTERGLLKNLDMWGKGLIRWEKQLNSVSKSLESAKSKLNDLKNSAAQLSDSVKSGVLSSANITKGASGDGLVTTSSVMAGLTASRDKATAFTSALEQLKGRGLRSDLIQQIGEAGIEGGGLETAGALLGASSSEISSINDLQRQITAAATSAGKVTSDAVYGAQIRAQEFLVKKLGAQQDKLIKSMDHLAKGMEKLVERAFGKKAAGGIVGAAASGGIRGGLTWVGEHEPELLQLPVGARVWSGPDSRRKAAEAAPWASMLTAPSTRRATPYANAPAAAGGAAQPLVIQVSIAGREFGELWVDTGRREVRARGSLDATLRPPRGR